MSAGITKKNGAFTAPSQRPSTISFYKITISGQDATGQSNVVNGTFDQILRSVSQIATIGMIGTPVFSASNTTLVIGLEDTGVDANSASGLGLGSANDVTTYATTALALQASIRALNTVSNITLGGTSSTVATFAL
jgi:hypothetical protein